MKLYELLIEEIKTKGYERIEEFVSTEQTENNMLDFKLVKTNPDSSSDKIERDDKHNFAKEASAFSNTSGGLIIWGINCRKNDDGLDCAFETKPIKNLKKFHTKLNNITNEALEPLNSGVEHFLFPIRDTDEGYIVSLVPESEFSPIKAKFQVNDYYIRSIDSSVAMSHDILRQMFAAKQKPKLEIYHHLETIPQNSTNENLSVRLIIGIKNVGLTVSTYPAIKIKPKNFTSIDEYHIDGNGKSGLEKRSQGTNPHVAGTLFAGGVNDVIYPNYELAVTKLNPKNKNLKITDIIEANQDENLFEFEFHIYGNDFVGLEGKVEVKISEVLEFIKQNYKEWFEKVTNK